jgi:hypothetical protein
MSYTIATSEFTDLKNTDWKVKIVSVPDPGVGSSPFSLGPDGFSLTYDFDEYDRCKPIVGSRVQITLYHPTDTSVSNFFDAFYNALDTAEEGTYRIEIYRDPDSANELWWAGAIMPEQTVIPDDYPHAPVTLTAVDGLANLKGIDYNNDGAAYTGTALVLEHLHNIIQKLHISDIWTASDVELKFFEDYIGKEYKDFIDGDQNKQLENAQISHEAYYNKDDQGVKQYFSAYEVLESLAITFNVSVFMAQGSIWWVPLGAIQSHASNGTSIANFMLGDGTRTYNTVANVTTGAIFGTNSAQWEKLKGWERTSAPAFKEVLRSRDYQGLRGLVNDSLYSRTQLINTDVLSDEDIEYAEDQQFLFSGTLVYQAPPFGWITPDIDRVARVKLEISVKFGDAGGTVNYLKRNSSFDSANIQTEAFINFTQFGFPAYNATDPWDILDVYRAQTGYPTWSATPETFDIYSPPFDKIVGNADPLTMSFLNPLTIPFAFLTPELPADATGLQISAHLTGVDWQGVEDTSIGATSNSGGFIQYRIDNFRIQEYSSEQAQEFNSIDITATNTDNARYEFGQGTTIVGDRISDYDKGVIKINNGSNYVDSTEWTNLQSSTSELSINGLGVRERLAANKTAKRIERGTLYQRGSTYIHPYTILTNTADSGNFYQVTGLNYIANRCEYDLQCMFLSREITGVTVSQDNSKGDAFVAPPGPLPTTKGPNSTDNVVNDNSTKLEFVTTDTYGITQVTTSTGSSAIDISLPISKSGGGEELVTINALGAMAPLADGASGEFLKTNGAGALSWAAAGGGGGGWFGSTSLLKVMPCEFMANDDAPSRNGYKGLYIEDDTSGIQGVRVTHANTEMYVMKAIPTGYKATHVQVYGSTGVVNGVEVYMFRHTTGSSVSQGTGNINALIDITDISSTVLNNISVKVLPGSDTIIIYGVDITIAAI